MRFDQLQIPAFGPFTDFSLTFESSSSDLHLIYGANERGKSSLLRAIDHLLFGIPARSTDNFLHTHQKLRIGATVSVAGSETLTFQRKKGNVNTLLDTDGNALPDTSLKAFLGPVDRGFFRSMFGLDTTSLREGADALIAGEGELGSALFSASLGSTDIDAAIAKLEEEADGLFKARSTKARIPMAMKAYKECEKALREATTRVTTWKTHQKALKVAQEDFERVDEVQRVSQQRLRVVERLLSALPITSQLAYAREGLKELAHLPELGDDFAQQVKQAREQVRERKQSVGERENQLVGLREQLAAVTTQPEILKRSEEIEHLHQALEAHLNRERALPSLRAEYEVKSTQLEQALDKLGLTTADLPGVPEITVELVETAEGLKEALAEATGQVTLAKTTLARLTKESAVLTEELSEASAPESSTVLKALGERARSAESARSRMTELTAELKKLSRAKETLSARLSLTNLAVDRIQQLAPPSAETIHEEKARLEELEKRMGRAQDELSDLDHRKHDEKTALETLREQGARHTQEDLANKRRERDEHLTAALEGEAMSRKVLPREVREADEMADSLRSHAEQIARAENHARTIADLQGKRELASSALEKLSAERDQWQMAWESRCLAIPAPVQPPYDLIGWVAVWQELCTVLDRIAEIEDEVEALSHEIDGAHGALAEVLGKAGAEFDTLVALLEERLGSIAEAAGVHQERLKRQDQLKRDLADAEEAIEKAETECERQQAVLAELTARFPAPIDGLQRVQGLANFVADLNQRIMQEEAAIQDMSTRLLAVRSEATQENHAADVGQLWSELETAKAAASQAQVLQASIHEAEEKRSHDKAALESAIATVTELRELCGAADMAALEGTLAEIERKSEFRKTITKVESDLASMSGGQPLERFIEEATGSSEDNLQSEKTELERVLPEHQAARDAAREQLNVLKAEDARLQQASDAAADRRQQAELHLSGIVSDTKRFMELQHAIQFLRQQIETYRERTQGPMLQSTSTYFAALTNGGFTKVAAQLTEKNVPKLVGVREDGSFVETTAMSEGTADQLYLALRFAAIDLHLSTYSPMPLVLDDLLITFDDERTTALLPILAKLSQKTQILVFTHHQHLLDLFECHLPGEFASHRL